MKHTLARASRPFFRSGLLARGCHSEDRRAGVEKQGIPKPIPNPSPNFAAGVLLLIENLIKGIFVIRIRTNYMLSRSESVTVSQLQGRI